MMFHDDDDSMPDKMNIWVAIGGYGLGAAIIFVMFYWSLPATQIS